jgi:hypothetical protein
MRPTDELRNVDVKSATISLTGDGRREQSILKALAERHDGSENVLQLPITVAVLGHGNKQTARYSGFSVLQTIKTYISKYGYRSFLFIVDIEHVNDAEDIASEIEDKLSELGFDAINMEVLENRAFLVKCKLGSYKIMVHAVICGEEKCIEENITELIFLEFGTSIAPKKPAIDQFLRQNRTNLYLLVKNASPNHLQQTFTDLTAAFESMAETSSHTDAQN